MGAKAKKRPVEPEAPEDDPAEAGAPSGGLKPIKKAKVKKVITKEPEKVERPEVEEEEEEEEVGDGQFDEYCRSACFTFPEECEVDEAKLRRVAKSVGEVVAIHKESPTCLRCVFSSTGCVRQALLLHNKPLVQLPVVKSGKETSHPFADCSSSLSVSVDLPLAPENRIFVGNIPLQAGNAELKKAFQRFGKVAYVYRNQWKPYGFVAFLSPKSAKKALSAEVVMVRDHTLQKKAYHRDGPMLGWQESRHSAALSYLKSLAILNPFVLPSPVSTPVKQTKTRSGTADPLVESLSRSPLALTPAADPAAQTGGKKRPKKKADEDVLVTASKKPAQGDAESAAPSKKGKKQNEDKVAKDSEPKEKTSKKKKKKGQ